MDPTNPSNLFVVLMGVGTVFIGLICIILLVWLMGRICGALEKNSPASPPTPVQTTAPANGGEVVAAISAAIAENLGTDVNAIRITSIRKI